MHIHNVCLQQERSKTLETIMSFLSDHSLWGLLLGIVAVFLLVGIVKSMIKVMTTIAVIGLVMVVFFGFEPQEVIDKGKGLADVGTELFEENVKPILFGQLPEGESFIKQENGETVVEFDDVTHRLNDLLDQFSSEEQLNELLNQLNGDEQKLNEELK